MKTTFAYDHYYKYDELKSCLEYFADMYPQYCTLDINCTTEKGLNQYVMTLTDESTGTPDTKPGWYLDGNIHAGEVTASMTAMHTIDWLLTNAVSDPLAAKILKNYTVYVIPRVSPDGAEVYLTSPVILRSKDEVHNPQPGGIKAEDLDDDGVIRMMRIPTPYGAWKIDAEGKMAQRSPSDTDGQFYDVYPEGMLEAYDGDENLKTKKPDYSLDYNRNFPFGWQPEPRQDGAGRYPLSAVETKAVADFVLAHPNICGAAIGHTFGGMILIPPGTYSEKQASPFDMKVMHAIADMGREELGYTPMNIFDAFLTDQVNYDSGALDDWMYETQGIPAYTVEFWDMPKAAGVPFSWKDRQKESAADAMKRFYACMKWVQDNAPEYWLDWQPFEHPAFGRVEIGGFNIKRTFQNPPEKFLKEVCENDTKFNLRFIQASPCLTIDSLTCTKKAEGIYEIAAVPANKGYLPTNLTENGIRLKTIKPVEVTIDGAEVLTGRRTETVGQLEGYSATLTGTYFYGNITTEANAKAKHRVVWLVKGNEGDTVTVTASGQKAGSAAASITLH